MHHALYVPDGAAEVSVLQTSRQRSHQPLVLAVQLSCAPYLFHLRDASQRHDLFARRNDGILPDIGVVHPKTIGKAHADPHGTVGLAKGSLRQAEKPRADLLRNLVHGQAQPSRERGVNVKDDFGIAFQNSLVVHDPWDLLDFGANLLGRLSQHGHAVAEQLNLHRFGRAFQVADHILQNLDELDLNPGDVLLDLTAQVGDDFIRGALALGTRLHLDEDVALILLGSKQA